MIFEIVIIHLTSDGEEVALKKTKRPTSDRNFVRVFKMENPEEAEQRVEKWLKEWKKKNPIDKHDTLYCPFGCVGKHKYGFKQVPNSEGKDFLVILE
jgi:flavodoxin